jgi:hypothetical protein
MDGTVLKVDRQGRRRDATGVAARRQAARTMQSKSTGTNPMAQQAVRVHSDPQQTQRLADLCATLDDTERFSLTLIDGTQVEATVVARPVLQTFVDARGEEGVNAVLKLDVGDHASRVASRMLWLDEVVRVERRPAP